MLNTFQSKKNTDVEVKAEVCHIVTESLSDKYLGLPPMIGVDRVDCYNHIIKRILAMVNGWKERTLSYMEVRRLC